MGARDTMQALMWFELLYKCSKIHCHDIVKCMGLDLHYIIGTRDLNTDIFILFHKCAESCMQCMPCMLIILVWSIRWS